MSMTDIALQQLLFAGMAFALIWLGVGVCAFLYANRETLPWPPESPRTGDRHD